MGLLTACGTAPRTARHSDTVTCSIPPPQESPDLRTASKRQGRASATVYAKIAGMLLARQEHCSLALRCTKKCLTTKDLPR